MMVWILVSIYGAAQDSRKPKFLSELVRLCDNETQPIFLVGDLNILRPEEKGNDSFNPRWPFMFNAIIEI
jgi:hypothetical protein